jgi:hypothetical protein
MSPKPNQKKKVIVESPETGTKRGKNLEGPLPCATSSPANLRFGSTPHNCTTFLSTYSVTSYYWYTLKTKDPSPNTSYLLGMMI